MSDLTPVNNLPKRSYRPEQKLCPTCQHLLKRSHIGWRKQLSFSTGAEVVISWVYRCPNATCETANQSYVSAIAESLHLKHRRYSRELVIKLGYRRFWQHQTMYQLHGWLSQELHLTICQRQVLNLIGDFLALLRAGQPAKIRLKLKNLKGLVIGLDGMQPEKGNKSLYIVRELQTNLTLRAESVDEGSQTVLSDKLFEPLQALSSELGLKWQGVVSDAQESIGLAVAHSLPGVAHQLCQSHCLRDAGQLTFEADRTLKKQLKASFRQAIKRLHKRIQGLADNDPYRPVLLDYAQAIQSTLLEGGVAPFELGGIRVFEALDDLATSLLRCQKKGSMCFYAACWRWSNIACLLPIKWNGFVANVSG